MDLAASALISLAVGLGLWALLPRGVVLTREFKQPMPGTELIRPEWTIRNASALPVTLTKVVFSGVDTYNEKPDEIEECELRTDIEVGAHVELYFDDEVLFVRQSEKGSWRGVTVPPGDTLTAFVNLNRSLTVHYRLSGLFGVFERRSLEIHGGT